MSRGWASVDGRAEDRLESHSKPGRDAKGDVGADAGVEAVDTAGARAARVYAVRREAGR
jgi:hypothetical protein